jgi:hypothetical protein
MRACLRGWCQHPSASCSVVPAGVVGFDWLNLSYRLGEAGSALVRPSVGIGLVIVVVGRIAAVVAGFVRTEDSFSLRAV